MLCRGTLPDSLVNSSAVQAPTAQRQSVEEERDLWIFTGARRQSHASGLMECILLLRVTARREKEARSRSRSRSRSPSLSDLVPPFKFSMPRSVVRAGVQARKPEGSWHKGFRLLEPYRIWCTRLRKPLLRLVLRHARVRLPACKAGRQERVCAQQARF